VQLLHHMLVYKRLGGFSGPFYVFINWIIKCKCSTKMLVYKRLEGCCWTILCVYKLDSQVQFLHQMLVYKCQSLLFAYVRKVLVVLVCSNLLFVNVRNVFSCFSLGCVFSFVVPKLAFCEFS